MNIFDSTVHRRSRPWESKTLDSIGCDKERDYDNS